MTSRETHIVYGVVIGKQLGEVWTKSEARRERERERERERKRERRRNRGTRLQQASNDPLFPAKSLDDVIDNCEMIREA